MSDEQVLSTCTEKDRYIVEEEDVTDSSIEEYEGTESLRSEPLFLNISLVAVRFLLGWARGNDNFIQQDLLSLAKTRHYIRCDNRRDVLLLNAKIVVPTSVKSCSKLSFILFISIYVQLAVSNVCFCKL